MRDGHTRRQIAGQERPCRAVASEPNSERVSGHLLDRQRWRLRGRAHRVCRDLRVATGVVGGGTCLSAMCCPLEQMEV